MPFMVYIRFIIDICFISLISWLFLVIVLLIRHEKSPSAATFMLRAGSFLKKRPILGLCFVLLFFSLFSGAGVFIRKVFFLFFSF